MINKGAHEPTGDSKTDQWGRFLVRLINSTRILSVQGGTLQQRPNGYNLILNPGGGGTSTPSTLDPFTLTAIKGDYLECTPRGGGATVNVAKSPCLWQSVTSAVIEGVTVTYSVTAYVANVGRYVRRDATINGVTIKEEVTPPYIVGQPIYAMKVTGGTGATAPAGTTVDYVSMADPRAWGTRADQST